MIFFTWNQLFVYKFFITSDWRPKKRKSIIWSVPNAKKKFHSSRLQWSRMKKKIVSYGKTRKRSESKTPLLNVKKVSKPGNILFSRIFPNMYNNDILISRIIFLSFLIRDRLVRMKEDKNAFMEKLLKERKAEFDKVRWKRFYFLFSESSTILI